MKVLGGSNAEKEINKLLAGAKEIRLAVAYWGEGAIDRLKLKELKTKDIVIVCDLLSGGCNPREVEGLIEIFGQDKVLKRDGLHAKVWYADKGVIIGSSNASANGFGDENDEMLGLLEANTLIRSSDFLAETKSWFEREVLSGAGPIGDADLKIARRRWKLRRLHRLPPLGRNPFSMIEQYPRKYVDKDILVWIYEESDFDAWVDKALTKERQDRHHSKIECWQNVKAQRPGTMIIEFHVNGKGAAKYNGVWQVLKDRPVVKTKLGRLLLCQSSKELGKLSVEAKARWEGAATDAFEATDNPDGWEGSVDTFVSSFLSVAPRGGAKSKRRG